MKAPTAQELLRAKEASDKAGPVDSLTFRLTMLVLEDPTLVQRVDDMMQLAQAALMQGSVPEEIKLRTLIHSALVAGLNMGIRIGEARPK